MADERVTIGWRLDRGEREQLLSAFPPRWPDVIADHVTLAAGEHSDTAMPRSKKGMIVGQVDDGAGLQALVVQIDGATDRPDGSTYHITWSLDRARGRHAADSNEVIRRLGWQSLASPVPVNLQAARL